MKTNNRVVERGFDVVVFVATTDEKNAVVKESARLNNAKWSSEKDGNGENIDTLLLKNKKGKILRIALQTLPTMGAEACVYYALRFLTIHPCQLVAMVGICAGKKGKAKKGDIIIPGRVACIFGGKEYEDNDRNIKFKPYGRSYEVRGTLRKEVDSFAGTKWNEVHAEITRLKNEFRIPSNTSPSLKFEEKDVMVQVAHVRAYTDSFEDLEEHVSRGVVALEMESAALAFVVEKIGEEKSKWLVVKGVQDYADLKKDDRYRVFGSWASFFTLTKFLELSDLDLWKDKVRVANDNERGSTAKTVEQLTEAYSRGNFSEANLIGDEIFNSDPSTPNLWRPYIRALLREQEYKKAADVIGIVDYIIQTDGVVERDFIDYLVEKADYCRRTGAFEDALVLIDRVRNSHASAIDEQKAQANYIRGRICLGYYQRDGGEQNLEDSKRAFQAAINMWPKKYWAEISLLLVKLVKARNVNPFKMHSTDSLWSEISQQIVAYPRRPAPRIYKLKLLAIQAASTEIVFDDFESRVLSDAAENYGQITLPLDFFDNLDSDFRLIFDGHRDRYRAISLMYKWAALTSKPMSSS